MMQLIPIRHRPTSNLIIIPLLPRRTLPINRRTRIPRRSLIRRDVHLGTPLTNRTHSSIPMAPYMPSSALVIIRMRTHSRARLMLNNHWRSLRFLSHACGVDIMYRTSTSTTDARLYGFGAAAYDVWWRGSGVFASMAEDEED